MKTLMFICSLLLCGSMNADDFHSKVSETIHRSDSIPGTLKNDIAKTWETLVQEGVIEVSSTDKDVRPVFVGLQGVVEHVLATELQTEIQSLKGVIHTPMPATPLCMNGDISKELVDPSIEMDPNRLFTVKARATILRDYLFKGADLYVVYPKDGLLQRTEEQRAVYKQELMKFPTHLFDVPLDCEEIPNELIGATYFFQDQTGKTFVFAIQMTQAKDPQEMGHFGLWFGPLESPAIQKRAQAVSLYLKQNGLELNVKELAESSIFFKEGV